MLKICYKGRKYIRKKQNQVYLPVDMNNVSDCEIWSSRSDFAENSSVGF